MAGAEFLASGEAAAAAMLLDLGLGILAGFGIGVLGEVFIAPRDDIDLLFRTGEGCMAVDVAVLSLTAERERFLDDLVTLPAPG